MRIARLLALFPLFLSVTSAFCFDFSSFPVPIEKGDVLISAGFDVGLTDEPSALMGGVLSLDYALPVDIGLTIGIEVGMAGGDAGKDRSVGVIPVLARFAWHPNWGVRNLDTSVMMKMGVGIGFWLGDRRGLDNPGGIALGIGVGARYFLSQRLGVFAELGCDYYMLPFKSGAEELLLNAMKLFTVGVTFTITGGAGTE